MKRGEKREKGEFGSVREEELSLQRLLSFDQKRKNGTGEGEGGGGGGPLFPGKKAMRKIGRIRAAIEKGGCRGGVIVAPREKRR